VQESRDHSTVTFPHCACDSRKQGHVIVKISFENFKLFACTSEGELESQVIDFSWDEMKQWNLSEDSDPVFKFQYQRGEKKARWVEIYSSYSSYMMESFVRVLEERKWMKEVASSNHDEKSEENIFVEIEEDQ